jgi:hypothetical protein
MSKWERMVMHLRVAEFLTRHHGDNMLLMAVFRSYGPDILLQMYPAIQKDKKYEKDDEVVDLGKLEGYINGGVVDPARILNICKVDVSDWALAVVISYIGRLVRPKFESMDIWQLEECRELYLGALEKIDGRIDELGEADGV